MSHLGWCEKINRIGGMAGRKHTIETKLKQSKSAYLRYTKEEERTKTSLALKERFKDPSLLEIISRTHKGAKHSEKTKELISKKCKKYWENNRDELLLAYDKRDQPLFRTNVSLGVKKYYNDNPDAKRKLSEKIKTLWENEVYRGKMKEIHSSNEWKTKMREIRRKSISPNKAEIKLGNILNKLYPDDWKFVGTGEVSFGNHVPDL